MKKIIIPCLSATLLFGAMGYASPTAAHTKELDEYSTYIEKKKIGLENALSHVSNPQAQAAIERNMAKHQEKWEEKLEKEQEKWEKKLEKEQEKWEKKIEKEKEKIEKEEKKKDKKKDKNKDKKKDKNKDKCDIDKAVALSTFTIGGIDVSQLKDLTSKDGASLKVKDFDRLRGIVVKAKEKDAKVSVSLNGSPVSADYLANVPLLEKDVIIVTVEKNKAKQAYKVTLVSDIKETTALHSFTIGGIDVNNLKDLNSKEGAILGVKDFSRLRGIAVKAEDKDAKVSVTLNGSVISADYLATVPLMEKDVIIVTVEKGEYKEMYKVTLLSQNKEATDLNTFTIGGVDITTLKGLTSKEGAILNIGEAVALRGIVIKAENKDAKVSITLNGSPVSSEYLANVPLIEKDVIVATVEHGKEKQTYKVTLKKDKK